MANTQTILIFLTFLGHTQLTSNVIARKNYPTHPSLIDSNIEEMPIAKPQIGALVSALAPTIGGFFSNLVTPMLSTLTDRIAKPSITQRE